MTVPSEQVANSIKIALSPETKKAPDFDKEVLEPLRIAQEKAAQAAAEAAQAAEAQRAQEVARQQAQAVQTAPPQAYGDAKMFIYMHESGNNPGAINASSGACGLGQALPCSKMPCSLSDYACQDNFFTQYMLGRYGSWENAKAFWLAHSWW